MTPSHSPLGPQYAFWRRQRIMSNGSAQFPAPIYVRHLQTGVAQWYREDGTYSSPSSLSPSTVEHQGGVRLSDAPWDPALMLPEGF